MRDWVRRGIIAAALLVAAVSLVLAFNRGRDEPPVVRRGAILRVFPDVGTVALRQDAIGVDLSFGYDATLAIDRRNIPDDQLEHLTAINRVSFSPGTGKEIPQLDPGRHCATIHAFPTGHPENTTTQPYTWCFQAA
jgi:hypothetical protein